MAIDHGWIKSVDTPVLSFFPEYADLRTPEKDRITLRHLLTMSSGLDWHESDVPYTDAANSEIRMDTAPDPYRFALEQPMVAPPGQIWNYNSGSTELLGAVLRKATGKPLDQLARTMLFGPLGITDVEWYRYAQDNPSAAAGLRLRPRDLAKIGQVVLQHGAWNGKRLVSASWVGASTTPQINGQGVFFYGYQFWLGRSLVDKREVVWAACWGLGGHEVMRMNLPADNPLDEILHEPNTCHPGSVDRLLVMNHVRARAKSQRSALSHEGNLTPLACRLDRRQTALITSAGIKCPFNSISTGQASNLLYVTSASFDYVIRQPQLLRQLQAFLQHIDSDQFVSPH
jgi:CubicO group peptidase (beta-lactamase class C family)